MYRCLARFDLSSSYVHRTLYTQLRLETENNETPELRPTPKRRTSARLAGRSASPIIANEFTSPPEPKTVTRSSAQLATFNTIQQQSDGDKCKPQSTT